MNQNFITDLVLAVSLLFSLVALIVVYFNYRNLRDLNELRHTFFAGKNGVELEHILFSLSEHFNDLQRQQELTHSQLETLREHFRFAIQKVGVIKFNPFADVGGSFSFSLALLDENNTGVVITNMHGRERNRIYSKRITQGESEAPLTEEEEQALRLADQIPAMGKIKRAKQKTKS